MTKEKIKTKIKQSLDKIRDLEIETKAKANLIDSKDKQIKDWEITYDKKVKELVE